MTVSGKFRPERLVLIDAGNSRLKYRVFGTAALETLMALDAADKTAVSAAIAQGVANSVAYIVDNQKLAGLDPGKPDQAEVGPAVSDSASQATAPEPLERLVELAADPSSRVLLASVAQSRVSASLGRLKALCGRRFTEASVVQTLGRLHMSYDRIANLGVDRWLAMLACSWRSNSAFCVIDCGSAITADFVTVDGLHEGGLIAPGYTSILASLDMADSLRQAIEAVRSTTAPKISRDSLAGLALGRSSAECLAFGVERMAGDFVRAVTEQAASVDRPYAVYTTGGGWQQLAHRVSVGYRYVEGLVFEGLVIDWIAGPDGQRIES